MSDSEIIARINRRGDGLTVSWKAASAVITAAVLSTVAYVNLVNTSSAHTATLAEHTVALHELKADFREVSAKVDAILMNQGTNPRQVLKDAGISPSR